MKTTSEYEKEYNMLEHNMNHVNTTSYANPEADSANDRRKKRLN